MFGVEFGYLTNTCVAVLTVILFFYWYSMRNHDFWKNRGVPYIKISPFYWALTEIGKKHLHDIEQERYEKYGKMYGYLEFNRPLLSVADPDLIRDILVKDFQTFNSRRVFVTGNEIFDKMVSVMKGDEDWKRIRSIITPTFTTGKIKKMMSILKDCSNTVVRNFKELSGKGQYIDAKRLYGTYTMDVIASSAFSTKIDSHNDPDNRFVQNASRVFNQKINWRLIVLFMFPFLTKIFKIDFFPGEVMEFFKQITIEIMEERKRTGQTRNDFLQLLMDTAKEVVEEPCAEEKGGDIASNYGVQEDINPHILKSVTSKKLSMNELVSQCVIFFIGGYDTTASTLSFATYFLAVNPEVQGKAREEVDQAIKEADGELTNEGIQKMKYLDNVISETLRMYPPLIRYWKLLKPSY
ncbi:hypothetical protein JTE90_018704 [Oedothorax gibbosus]|uniref:Cytochrome P450 n=1 Tax=Oedothorax gibbosus TaxID=931172 RepID=A0AAV6TZJ1_9ARAC|nr:hypothetical protein JTE90_018704 [Oedothorax gibbosus]